jgi:hypothetical protein
MPHKGQGFVMEIAAALDVVYAALVTVNEIRPADQAIALEPHVVLTGEGGTLDSLALVTLVLAIEGRIFEASGREISLMDDREFEFQASAFRTPATLAALILQKTA